ncbi:MAG: AAA family ATPase [Kofleriaceae bacterium]|nr:AAA family ATPase [Kofleriaceae bacterium]
MSAPKKESCAKRIIAVGGGKGGVGKSVLSANIAVAFAERGQRVILIDADLGMANAHTLFNIKRPGKGIGAVLDREVAQLADTAVPTGVPNLTLIPGTSASPGTANINHGQKQKLLRQIRSLDADVVMLDCGAGAAFNTLDFFIAADTRLIVVTPQLTSIQNAYGFLKGAVHRLLIQTAGSKARKELVTQALANARGVAKLPEVLANIQQLDPVLFQALQSQIDFFGAKILGNYIYSPKEEKIVQTMGRLSRDFLGVHATTVGAIPASNHMNASVNARVPLLNRHGSEPLAIMVRQVASLLATEDIAHLRNGRITLPRNPEDDSDDESEAPVATQQSAGSLPSKAIH